MYKFILKCDISLLNTTVCSYSWWSQNQVVLTLCMLEFNVIRLIHDFRFWNLSEIWKVQLIVTFSINRGPIQSDKKRLEAFRYKIHRLYSQNALATSPGQVQPPSCNKKEGLTPLIEEEGLITHRYDVSS